MTRIITRKDRSHIRKDMRLLIYYYIYISISSDIQSTKNTIINLDSNYFIKGTYTFIGKIGPNSEYVSSNIIKSLKSPIKVYFGDYIKLTFDTNIIERVTMTFTDYDRNFIHDFNTTYTKYEYMPVYIGNGVSYSYMQIAIKYKNGIDIDNENGYEIYLCHNIYNINAKYEIYPLSKSDFKPVRNYVDLGTFASTYRSNISIGQYAYQLKIGDIIDIENYDYDLNTTNILITKNVVFSKNSNVYMLTQCKRNNKIRLTALKDSWLIIRYLDGTEKFPDNITLYRLKYNGASKQDLEHIVNNNNYFGIQYKEINYDYIGSYRTIEANNTDYLNATLVQNRGHFASKLYKVSMPTVCAVKARDDCFTHYALLSTNVTQNSTTVEYIDSNRSERQVIAKSCIDYFIIDKPCILYVLCETNDGIIYEPEWIRFFVPISNSNNNNIVESDINITRYAVNLFNENNILSNRSISTTGEIVNDNNSKITDFIKINIGSKWYQHTKYLHCCCSIYKTEMYNFRANIVCFYDSDKQFISYYANVSTAIEIPDGAYYVVVSFPSTATDLFVSTNNSSLLKKYHKYNPEYLVASKYNYYETINNSDGAVTTMLQTGLDYINDDTLGYGDNATAFDYVVEPIPSEFSTPKYTGEKMQIDCSGFTELCLHGISYANSRYNNPEGRNIETLYKFDDLAEYNCDMTYGFGRSLGDGANYGKMYASKLYKYAEDRGFGYIVQDGFKNVEPGDILFLSNDSTASPYKNIGHVLFCSNTYEKSDGTKYIDIMQNGSAGSKEILNYSRPTTLIYGARFPLPFKPFNYNNLINNFNIKSGTINISQNEEYLIGEYQINNTFKAKTIYTIIINANIPNNCIFVIKINDTIISDTFTDLYRRLDGNYIKHINIYSDSAINTNKFKLYVKANSNVNSNYSINNIKVYYGYTNNYSI